MQRTGSFLSPRGGGGVARPYRKIGVESTRAGPLKPRKRFDQPNSEAVFEEQFRHDRRRPRRSHQRIIGARHRRDARTIGHADVLHGCRFDHTAVPVIGTFSAPGASSCRFAPVDNTNWVGEYEIQLADSLFNTSDASRFIKVIVYGAANLYPTEYIIELNSVDFQNGVNAGITALPPAVASAAGGLLVQGTGANQITTNGAGLIEASVSAYGTGLDPEDQVWGASASSYVAGGTMGALENLIANIDTFGIIVVAPVNQSGNVSLIGGMAYLFADGNSCSFQSQSWTNIVGLTVTMFNPATSTVIATGTVRVSGAPPTLQQVTFDFTSASTTSLLATPNQRFVIRAAVAGGNFIPLASGLLLVSITNF